MDEHKAFKPQIKALSERGEGLVVVATLGVKDKDNDVTLPGFFGRQDVQMVPSHQWGHVPLGKGVLSEQGDEALYEFAMNLKVPAAADWYEAMKFDLDHAPSLQEYSYAFSLREGGWRFGEWEGQQVRFLQPAAGGGPGAQVHEVSPVLRGAGEGTRTLDLKGEKPFANEHACRLRDPDDFQADSFRRTDREHEGKRYSVIMGRLKGETTMTEQAYRYPKDIWTEAAARAHCRSHDGQSFEPAAKMDALTYVDHAERVLADAQALVNRSEELASLRAKEGRVLSTTNRQRLSALLEALAAASVDIRKLLEDTQEPEKGALLRELLTYQRTLAQLARVH